MFSTTVPLRIGLKGLLLLLLLSGGLTDAHDRVFAQRPAPKKLSREILESKEEAKQKMKKRRKNLEAEKDKKEILLTPADPLATPNAQLIYIENNEYAYVNQELHPDVYILVGDVQFRHDNSLLYCDSAYFNEQRNSFEAFGQVRMVQADTLFVYGDYLSYNGNTKVARLRNNVRLENKSTVLTTDSMNYDRIANLAYYYTGGKITDAQNTLTSIWGQYSPATDQALFQTDVLLTNPSFVLKSDTLKYNTNTNIANIVGTTHIIYKEETNVYSTKGWYNTSSDRMMLLDRSRITHKDGTTMVGDTIFYDRKKKYGEAFSGVVLNDTVQKSTLKGDFLSYNELNEEGLATDSALLIDWSQKDSLFLHADTLFTFKDSIYDKVDAYKNVRFYRKDIQGMCDSLSYSGRDSTLFLRYLPVIWVEENQIIGDKISVFSKNEKVDKVLVEGNAIAIQQDTLIYFNQLAGKKITALLDSNQVKRVDIDGNAETIFFPKDDNTKKIVGVNKTLSSYVKIFMKEEEIERIKFMNATSGKMYPLAEMAVDDLYLHNFHWYGAERPLKAFDVFSFFEKKERVPRKESQKRPDFPGQKSSSKERSNSKKRNSSNTTSSPHRGGGEEEHSDTTNPRDSNSRNTRTR